MPNGNYTEDPRLSNRLIPQCIDITVTSGMNKGDNGTAMMLAYCLCMIFIAIANSLLILGLYRTRVKRFTSAQRILVVLSCSDLSVGLVYIPMKLYSMVNAPNVSCQFNAATAFWSPFPVVFSEITIMFLTIDRYLLMAGHKKKKNGYKSLVAYVLPTFCISSGFGIWLTLVLQESPSETTFQKMSIWYICSAVFGLCVLATSLVFNILILKIVNSATKNSSLKTTKRMAERKLTHTIVIINSTLVITYLPSVIVVGIFGVKLQSLSQGEVQRAAKIFLWTLNLTLINSGLNATIFILRNTSMKKMFRSVYNKQMRPSHDSPPSNIQSNRNGAI